MFKLLLMTIIEVNAHQHPQIHAACDSWTGDYLNIV